jgi:hypothetical protein
METLSFGQRLTFAILFAFTLVPIVVRVIRARRDRRPVHIFDDIVANLMLPFMVVCFVVPLSPVALRIALAVFGAITVVSIWRLIREYRRSRSPEARVDGPPDGR